MTVVMPRLPTALALNKYKFEKAGPVQGKAISNQASGAQYAFDGKQSTKYFSEADTCYIGLDLGANNLVKLQQIRYFPDPTLELTKIHNSVFEGSLDGSTYQ